jgi:hypothetical protein
MVQTLNDIGASIRMLTRRKNGRGKWEKKIYSTKLARIWNTTVRSIGLVYSLWKTGTTH